MSLTQVMHGNAQTLLRRISVDAIRRSNTMKEIS